MNEMKLESPASPAEEMFKMEFQEYHAKMHVQIVQRVHTENTLFCGDVMHVSNSMFQCSRNYKLLIDVFSDLCQASLYQTWCLHFSH